MIRQSDIENLKKNVNALQNEGYTRAEAIELLNVASINDLADSIQEISNVVQLGLDVNVAQKPYTPLI